MRLVVAHAPTSRADGARERTNRQEAGLWWATANGAHALGREGRLGTLAVSAEAHAIVVGGSGLHLGSIADPVGSLVTQTNGCNVRHVFVAGRIRKRDGQLIGWLSSGPAAWRKRPRDRVLGSVTDAGIALPPSAPTNFIDEINALAEANLTRAEPPGEAP